MPIDLFSDTTQAANSVEQRFKNVFANRHSRLENGPFSRKYHLLQQKRRKRRPFDTTCVLAVNGSRKPPRKKMNAVTSQQKTPPRHNKDVAASQKTPLLEKRGYLDGGVEHDVGGVADALGAEADDGAVALITRLQDVRVDLLQHRNDAL